MPVSVFRCSRCGELMVDSPDNPASNHLRWVAKLKKSDVVVAFPPDTPFEQDPTAYLIQCGPVLDLTERTHRRATSPIRALGRQLNIWEGQGDTTVSVDWLRKHFGLPSPYVRVISLKE